MKTGETWSNSQDAHALFARQKKDWPFFGANCEAFGRIETKEFCMDGLAFKVQYNPSRIVSAAAKTDPRSLRERPCFLCPAHLPPEQESLPMGDQYLLLCNPYPIFPEHFTIVARPHTAQSIRHTFPGFLQTARQLSDFTLFYNGPRSGASAPDHLHFQAVTAAYMPIDYETGRYKEKILEEKDHRAALYSLTRYIRNGFILEATTEEGACSLFKRIYDTLSHCIGDGMEPRMNIFCRYRDTTGWQVVVIPRSRHRPDRFYATGEEQILTSPGAADIGGVFITSRREDFEKLTPGILRDIYGQISYIDRDIAFFIDKLSKG
jgi:ATP adenylyltransferase/5',5'''-P-1,P-4-tetraphosphate phosphorylase II